MRRFMLLTFVFLGWAFYELSGGADFVPESAATEAGMPAGVTRAGTSAGDLLSVADVAKTSKSAAAPEKTSQPGRVKLAALETDLPAGVARPKTGTAGPDTDRPRLATTFVRLDAPGEAAPQPSVAASAPAQIRDLRTVTGNRVNMRNGPGTDYSVVAKLVRGDAVEILQDPGDGWVKLRVAETDRVGWMADFLLSRAE